MRKNIIVAVAAAALAIGAIGPGAYAQGKLKVGFI
jgi:hypothetical protein